MGSHGSGEVGQMSKHIKFVEVPQPGRKTRRWHVVAVKGGGVLGEIRFYSQWQQYVFTSDNEVVWNSGCLTAVVVFLNTQNRSRKK